MRCRRQYFTNAILAAFTLMTCGFGPGVRTGNAQAVQRLESDGIAFENVVGPIFSKHCVECHNDDRREGGLSLASQSGLKSGGDSGPAIDTSKPLDSHLMQMIVAPKSEVNGRPEMPKGRPPLSKSEVDAIDAWIRSGAHWPTNVRLQAEKPKLGSWWAFQPLQSGSPPAISTVQRDWCLTWIDARIASAHAEQGLSPVTNASRREWLRRVTFDLTGLPPTPEELDSFENDHSPDARERVVDRLLASVAHGEKLARAWLDLVHFGETHGYDKDKPRLNAWPYRDYVIRSLNEDIPYSSFIEQQIAGDALEPSNPSAIEATGFLSAGPWDFIGHAEVSESKIDGKIARHLDRDDMVQNTMLTFQSITVGCAQCHDHKFDPVSQREYYSLQAVFAAIDRTDQAYYRSPIKQAAYVELKQQEGQLSQQLADIEKKIAQAAGPQWQEIESKLGDLRKRKSSYPTEHGYHSAISTIPETNKWFQIDLGEAKEWTELRWVACHDDFANIGDGFGYPKRFKIEASNDPEFHESKTLLLDCTDADQPSPGIAKQSHRVDKSSYRYIRFTATLLAERKNDYIFALSEFEVIDAKGKNIAPSAQVSSLDSIESKPRWSRSNLIDGKAPTSTAPAEEIAELETSREQLLREKIPSAIREQLDSTNEFLNVVRTKLTQLGPADRVYTATIHNGQGAFAGTGPNGGRPRLIRILPRGDVRQTGDLVSPGALECMPGLEASIASADATDAQRRLALARWLSNRENPLTWRSMANRIWQWHFGRGIASTANDFGRMGQPPTHPELLDELAIDLRDHQSWKRLHRELLLSATYAQSSRLEPSSDKLQALQIDPENRWLARFTRRRLQAEEIRDTLLFVGDSLDRSMGGPSYQDFVIERPEHSPHYEYGLHDPHDTKTHRRTVYRLVVRSQTQPMLTSLDCADPSMQVDLRSESNSPTQALTLLNNRFSLAAARWWAERAERFVDHNSKDLDRQRVDDLFLRALGRAPKAEESKELAQYAQSQGLANTARVIFNLNEFLYVD